jgi:hypothetical protein
LNGDCLPDLVVPNFGGELWVLAGQPAGGFIGTSYFNSAGNLASVVLIETNGDTRLDAVCAVYTGGPDRIGVFLNQSVLCSASPTIVQQPGSVIVAAGQSAVLSVGAQAGTSPLSYQWRRNGLPLANGGTISGATSAQLVIDPVRTEDTAYYDVVVSSAVCVGGSQSTTSAHAVLAITSCYPNCDQSTVAPVLNVGDFTCFLQRFAAGCP